MIWLQEKDGNRSFPILIGVFEALAIERNLRGEPFPRPLTHDLLAQVIKALNATLERVIVTAIQNSTFYAKLVLGHNSSVFEIDSRPSDAIALATAMKAPMFVDDEVFKAVCTPQGLLESIDFKMESREDDEGGKEDWQPEEDEDDDDSDAEFGDENDEI